MPNPEPAIMGARAAPDPYGPRHQAEARLVAPESRRRVMTMNDVTRILSAVGPGDPQTPAELLPLVYDELRRLAARKLAREAPGQTLQATALVHEAYLRLVDTELIRNWDSRGHFFAAAAEAMRRILIENARRKQSEKHGGERSRTVIDDLAMEPGTPTEDLLALDEALTKLAAEDPVKARLVNLRYFAGLSVEDAAKALGISRATADRYWHYARVWLYCELHGTEGSSGSPEKSPGS
jgi:RNA polymerase sigma factor (TIGR02999 family)